MATTPPPPSRVRTPPTPLHGARYDNYEPYEPYSPRRSSRVAAQRKHYSQQQLTSHSTPKSLHATRSTRAATPTSSRNQTLTRTSSQTFSPPSSPSSPIKHSTTKSPGSGTRRRVSNGRSQHLAPQSFPLDSDSDNLATASTTHRLSTMDPRTMLPTPSKTPRKRAVQDLGSTARVLFPNRPANVDDSMPSPRKSRKNKKHAAFTLQSFVEEAEDDDEPSQIEIYTDSKERVPDLDEHEDNPFITTKKNSKVKANGVPEPKRRRVDDRTAQMEEAVRNNEGMIYVFRGRKIFRKFDDGPSSATSSDGLHLSEDEVRRKAGAEVHRPFTRSTIKPRLLFPNEEEHRQRELAADEADEEAVTDIEVPTPSFSNRKAKKSDEAVTPVKQHFRPTTPPSTGRARRYHKKIVAEDQHGTKVDEEAVLGTPVEAPVVEEEVEVQTAQLPKARGKKNSPFDSWQRVKPASSRMTAQKGVKREGEMLERGGEGKRSRSGVGAGAGAGASGSRD
ncbi:hypothetical protein K432DRAFT_332086 [Lepidopterella palustris CBS 459.81]|uniref:Uncharacterized protein n=1 Tax=Lepidopterella palustris CBS 459.81 TaxID=1314670 RepID=A0A8E2E6S7_9PEZI|nr:hypothetical protein K432DRAFT_332086 [Lepidopterella palustris CBS 459.81]